MELKYGVILQRGTNIINATPVPDFLIKSISEQGYSLEAAIADLIDNSVSARSDAIQVLVDSETEPFQLFLADNGDGMTQGELIHNMQFPSSSPDGNRSLADLGRFGLGLKAASFSQTRKFTVLSRKRGDKKYFGLTWDVEHLVKTKKWELLVNSEVEVNKLLNDFNNLNQDFNGEISDFSPNTIVIWSGLYKFEKYLKEHNRKKALNREIVQNTTEHLGIVFHRFLDNPVQPLTIRVNNSHIKPFNPFPENQQSLRKLEFRQKDFGHDNIKLEGFVLPSFSIKESQQLGNDWTTPNKSLLDMEGVYIYRSNRLIIYGGWNGLIRKSPRLQLARLRVDIGNKADHLLHLNVAKSQVIIPHDLIKAFKGYIEELTSEAEKEFYNRGIKKFTHQPNPKEAKFLKKIHSNKGPLLELNHDFPLLNDLVESCNQKQKTQLLLLVRMINTAINKIRDTHENVPFYRCEETKDNDFFETILSLKNQGFSSEFIKKNLISELGIELDTLPTELLKILE
ncbi:MULTISPECIES: ATP-binding protein [unclassified Pseudoalteromonas]|uniref:ATP-binding protein n=1 Tax=unclassified Pseudoalteromonas TaxID=194690 RepID=UPI00257EA923|nr:MULTISPECIES: ATP-binding protein [unclassified Pseudoalteromonas]|tara:strand:+ start:2409 stop:3941 length:1533 start_codon:yes stop_codon:yes gene_type:complete